MQIKCRLINTFNNPFDAYWKQFSATLFFLLTGKPCVNSLWFENFSPVCRERNETMLFLIHKISVPEIITAQIAKS